MILDAHSNNPNIRVVKLCEKMGVPRRTFYVWKKQGKELTSLSSSREKRKFFLKTNITEIFNESKGTYGYPRVYKALLQKGIKVSLNTVAKYMGELNLNADRRKKRKIVTTDSNHSQSIVDRLFKTKESDLPQSPGKIYVGDITYLPFKAGQKPRFLYMATVMDLFNREIVGCALSKTMDAHLVCKALGQAKPLVISGETIFHSDQGSQYASQEFRQYLKQLGIKQSMSRKGNCYDNAYMERFFSSLKRVH